MSTVDLFVIGGGINGAAVARDAAGRGLSVYLAERGDYACATSSASSKLIHGGLRYLEQYEFRLVQESLHEREVLMRIAPHLVTPLRFLVPVTMEAPRPAWMVRFGLWLYDRLSGHRLIEPAGRLSQAEVDALPHLKRAGLRAVLHYPDCQVDDARLVLETLLDARARGADIGNRREVTALHPRADGYGVEVRDNGYLRTIQCRFVVDAAGPWANDVLEHAAHQAPLRALRLVRGSHIVVALPDPAWRHAYTLQNDDGRVVFAIPWQERYLLIGTTDIAHEGDPAQAHCTEAERDYLLACYNAYFHPPLSRRHVLWSFAGVRPLVDDGTTRPSDITRDYVLETRRRGNGGLVIVYGGKLTTHRRLGERVMKRLARLGAALGPAWTETAPLHGGELGRSALAELAGSGPAAVPAATRRRWTLTYGACTRELYARIAAAPATAREVVPGVPEAELVYAVETEDVRQAEDFLQRRTKLFLELGERERETVSGWFLRHAA
jgi:glycerol-3-phosphate dehydrogenase